MIVLLRDIVPVSPVPLPAAAWLLSGGLISLLSAVRRRTGNPTLAV
jgi:hypothetical protein